MRLVALTGAGISAESGIPTFREAQTGLWERYDPMQLATPEAFRADPKLVWGWYQWRRKLCAEAEPNAGHRALVELERALESAPTESSAPERRSYSLVTQNVDGLHRRAGSQAIVEFHGNIHGNHCFDCGADGGEVALDVEGPPPCSACGGLLRPSVVWFGEAIPEDALQLSFEAVASCDLCLVVGTSSLVHPAAGLPDIALANGAEVVEINPEETPLTARATRSIRGTAAEVLPGLVDELVEGLMRRA